LVAQGCQRSSDASLALNVAHVARNAEGR